jgi:hypothetical protein
MTADIPDDEKLPALPVLPGYELKKVSDSAWQAVQRFNSPASLFERGGEIVRLVKDSEGARLQPVTENIFRHVLERSARFIGLGDGGRKKLVPPP